jgi:hypothetical protein
MWGELSLAAVIGAAFKLGVHVSSNPDRLATFTVRGWNGFG